MAQFGPGPVVDPPVATPPLHGLVDTGVRVTEPDDRWEQGFSYRPETCQCAELWHWSCDQTKPTKTEPDDVEGVIGYEPPTAVGVYECGSVGATEDEYRTIATRSLEASTSKLLEAEFWSGALVPSNPHLTMVGSTTVNPGGGPGVTAVSPVDVQVGLALLQEALAACCPGGRGMIHAPVAVASLWGSKAAISENREGKLQTVARGDYVVAGSGYPGTGPGGDVPPTGAYWVYATSGMTHVRLGPIQSVPVNMRQALNRRTNRVLWTAERTVAATWDNCCLLALLVQVVPQP